MQEKNKYSGVSFSPQTWTRLEKLQAALSMNRSAVIALAVALLFKEVFHG